MIIKMTSVGCLKPISLNLDFSPVVFIKENDQKSFFYANISNGVIQGFYPLEINLTNIIPITWKTYEKVSGDTGVFCYLNDMKIIAYGEYEEIYETIFELFKSLPMNIFAKLSVATFLKLWGKRQLLIKQIKYLHENESFKYFFRDFSQFHYVTITSASFHHFLDKFNQFSSVSNKDNHIENYLFIINDTFYFFSFLVSYDVFKNHFSNYQNFVKDFYHKLAQEEKEEFCSKNPTIFEDLFNSLPLSIFSEEIKQPFEIFWLENQFKNYTTYSKKLSSEDVELKARLCNLKKRFELTS